MAQTNRNPVSLTIGGDAYVVDASRISGGVFASKGPAVLRALAGALTGDDTQTNGKITAFRDNGSSFASKGPQHPSEGDENVFSYVGIFYNDGYDTTGTLKTRFITGGNLEMDVEIQSPHQLRLIGNDNSQADGQVFVASHTNMVLQLRSGGENVAVKQLIFDRVNTATFDEFNTSDVNIKSSSGSIHINNGVTTGALVVPILSEAQRDALTAIAGMVVYNTDSNKHEGYNGSSWNAFY